MLCCHNKKKTEKEKQQKNKEKNTFMSIKISGLKQKANAKYKKLKCNLCGKISKAHRAASLHIQTVHKRHHFSCNVCKKIC